MLKSYKFLLKSSYKVIIVGAIFSAASAALYMLALKQLNALLKSNAETLGIQLVYLVLLALGSAILGIVITYFLDKYYELKVNEIRLEAARHVLGARFDQVEKHFHNLPPILVWDINKLTNFAKSFSNFLVAVFKIIAIWGYMLTISWPLTIVTITIFCLITFISVAFLPALKNQERQNILSRNRLHNTLDGLVKGIKELSLSKPHRQAYINETIGQVSRSHSLGMIRIGLFNSILAKSIETIILLSLGFSVYFIVSSSLIDSETMLMFMALVLFIIPSFTGVSTFINQTKNAEIAINQLESLEVNLANPVVVEKKEVNRSDLSPLLSFEQIEFQYESVEGNSGYAVGPLDLEISQNELIIINGGNGSGKTTLGKMITGLYFNGKGSVRLNGDLINEQTLESYRNCFSASFTDSFVFQDLSYLGDKERNRLDQYIKWLGLEEKVFIKDNVEISTTNLSAGQRDRLNIMRVLAEDKDIILLDECVANQDPFFRKTFYEEMLPLLKSHGKTLILISHDDRFFHVADTLITMSSGQIVENKVVL